MNFLMSELIPFQKKISLGRMKAFVEPRMASSLIGVDKLQKLALKRRLTHHPNATLLQD